MKKLLAGAFLALAAPALLVSPAGAAVPSSKPKSQYACPGQPGKAARVWAKTDKQGQLTKFAVDNPCSQFLSFSRGSYASGDPRDMTLVAPGTHFNWGKKRIAANPGARLGTVSFESESRCMGATTVLVIWRYDDVRPPSDDC